MTETTDEKPAPPEVWYWIEFLENEMDPSLERDLELLLEHSQEDRDIFENFRLLKEWLVGSDPVGDWPLDSRLRKVRREVMRAVEHLPPPGMDGYQRANAAGAHGFGPECVV